MVDPFIANIKEQN